MNGRLKVVGVIVAVFGLAFLAGGGYAYYKVNQGTQALHAFSAAQNVTLTYNADGQLADAKGDTTEATAIMGLLANDWGFAVDKGELNPNDQVVNTTSEYMYQMATITYTPCMARRRSSSTRTPRRPTARSIPQARTSSRTTVAMDRFRPDQPDRSRRSRTDRTPTAIGLVGELGVGSATASALTLGLGMTAVLGGVGLMFLITGSGLAVGGSSRHRAGQGAGPPPGHVRRVITSGPQARTQPERRELSKPSPFRRARQTRGVNGSAVPAIGSVT
jgi:hypothetical protein